MSDYILSKNTYIPWGTCRQPSLRTLGREPIISGRQTSDRGLTSLPGQLFPTNLKLANGIFRGQSLSHLRKPAGERFWRANGHPFNADTWKSLTQSHRFPRSKIALVREWPAWDEWTKRSTPPFERSTGNGCLRKFSCQGNGLCPQALARRAGRDCRGLGMGQAGSPSGRVPLGHAKPIGPHKALVPDHRSASHEQFVRRSD